MGDTWTWQMQGQGPVGRCPRKSQGFLSAAISPLSPPFEAGGRPNGHSPGCRAHCPDSSFTPGLVKSPNEQSVNRFVDRGTQWEPERQDEKRINRGLYQMMESLNQGSVMIYKQVGSFGNEAAFNSRQSTREYLPGITTTSLQPDSFHYLTIVQSVCEKMEAQMSGRSTDFRTGEHNGGNQPG